MLRREDLAPAGSRWGRLADRRAAELLGSAHGTRTLVVDTAGGFPYAASQRPLTTVLSSLQVSYGNAVVAVPDQIPFPSETFTSVIDTTRPEGPADHETLLRELVRICRPGGTVALIACGGTTTFSGPLQPRSFERVEEGLRQACCDIERVVSFDVLSPLSPWRFMLGERREEVLRELEDHLSFRRVRHAVRLLERHLVARLPPPQVGRVLVVARRCHPGQSSELVPSERVRPPVRTVIEAEPFGGTVLRFMQDDAVVRWAAFVDAEFISPAALPFDLASYLGEAGQKPRSSAAAARTLLRRRRWRYPGLEVQRFFSAAIYRMVQQTVAALRDAPDALHHAVSLPDTFDYELFDALNTEITTSQGAGSSRCTDS